MELIDKDAVVAEIEKIIDILIKNSGCIGAFGENQITIYEDVLSLINTLEVKEVDIENVAITEWNDYIKKIDGEPNYAYMLIKREDYIALAKHFFELVLQEEPVEVKKECMYSKEFFTNKDRKVLCDGCEEDCKYSKKETVNDKLGGINNALVQDRLIASKPIGVPADAIELVSIPDKKEPVSEDLEEAAKHYLYSNILYDDVYVGNPTDKDCIEMFKAGAKWQKNNLWKPADGDDLPEIDREVIALLDNGKVVFAHRPQEYWDGKNIITGKVTRNYPKTYDKGGWNISDVKFWLDVELPKEIEL